jgi:hypothetical protein
MKLASFKAGGRISYGVVTDGGIIDLGRKLTQCPTLLDVFRAQALPQARAAATGQPDYQIKDVEMLPPILAPEKNICVGINYPPGRRRNIPTCFAGSRVRWSEPISRSCGQKCRTNSTMRARLCW